MHIFFLVQHLSFIITLFVKKLFMTSLVLVMEATSDCSKFSLFVGLRGRCHLRAFKCLLSPACPPNLAEPDLLFGFHSSLGLF